MKTRLEKVKWKKKHFNQAILYIALIGTLIQINISCEGSLMWVVRASAQVVNPVDSHVQLMTTSPQ